MNLVIRVFQGAELVELRELEEGDSLLVGRNEACDVVLYDLQASRQHAKLTAVADGLRVEDLNSRAGTRANSGLLHGESTLVVPPGKINVGSCILEVTLEDGDSATMLDTDMVWGQYEQEGLLGEGGYGRVFAARRISDGQRVAIKTVNLDRYADLRQRVEREGRLCAAIDHPNVVRLFEIRVEGALAYQVMELIEGGRDLVDRLIEQKGPLPIEEVWNIAESVAAGLGAIHAAGVVHRDIKPANILFVEGGGYKISDLGLARWLSSGETLTKSMIGMGTLQYMPPEQALDARRAQPSSDLYSLGATLYHMVTERMPFVQSDMERLLEAVNEHDPDPIMVMRPDCPPALAAVIHRLLAKTPAGRPADAAALLEELAQARSS